MTVVTLSIIPTFRNCLTIAADCNMFEGKHCFTAIVFILFFRCVPTDLQNVAPDIVSQSPAEAMQDVQYLLLLQH